MISLLVVNYRSAALAAAAVASARGGTVERLQVVIVDNSVDPAEAEALRRLEPDALVVSDTNRGYAGGINLGRRSCEGEAIVVANPDVTFAGGALDALVAALAAGAAAAGPAVFWDDAHQWHLPPADRGGTLDKLDEVLASRSPRWAAERDARRTRARIAFWSLTRPAEVEALSGAVLAVRAADFDAIGGFDERFELYFEEIDFLRRLRERRRRVVYVPGAKCRHVFNQSAQRDAGQSARKYAQSESKFLEKWSGPFVARTLERLGRPPRDGAAEPLRGPLRLARTDVIVEASPLPSFATAAGTFARGDEVALPPEVLASAAGPIYLRAVVRTTGEVLGRWMVEPAGPGSFPSLGD